MRHALGAEHNTVERIEAVYRTADLTAQRTAVLDCLAPRPGQHLLDVGCGPGFLAAEMARRVGPGGQVRGIDFSRPMLDLARRRCADLPWTSFEGAGATDLPYVNERFDAAAAVQVLEYLRDVPAALAEMHRVLRPGSRAVILDTDWGSLAWHADDQARMRRILGTWTTHLTHTHLPRRLAPALRRAGFQLRSCQVLTLFNPEYSPDSYSYSLIQAIREVLPEWGDIPRREVEAWAGEQQALGEQGRFFFSLNRYLFLVVKADYPHHNVL